MKVILDGWRPRLEARAAGSASCVLTALCASVDDAGPCVTMVTDASTLCNVLVAETEDVGTPRVAATADVSTIGAAREAVEDALRDCVKVKACFVSDADADADAGVGDVVCRYCRRR